MRKSSWRIWLLVFVALQCQSGCGGGGASEDSSGNDVAFSAVDAAARSTFDSLGLDGMGLTIYRADGSRVFEAMYGDFSADKRVFIASASKMVTGVTLFGLIDRGVLSLDTTTGEVLGWSGDKSAINVRQLLSFRSGLANEDLCTYVVNTTLEACVEQIYNDEMLGEPGTRFDYGSTHLQVAGRMAELATGQSWQDIFSDVILTPLGLPADIYYYTRPENLVVSANPLLAGGLVVSMSEYAKFLGFVYRKGELDGAQLIDAALFDQQAMDPYPDAIIGETPVESPSVRYGLTAWLECDTPTTGCAVISSPGLYGFTPWLDREHGYYAIIGMENHDLSQRGTAVALEQTLKPLIVEALQQL